MDWGDFPTWISGIVALGSLGLAISASVRAKKAEDLAGRSASAAERSASASESSAQSASETVSISRDDFTHRMGVRWDYSRPLPGQSLHSFGNVGGSSALDVSVSGEGVIQPDVDGGVFLDGPIVELEVPPGAEVLVLIDTPTDGEPLETELVLSWTGAYDGVQVTQRFKVWKVGRR